MYSSRILACFSALVLALAVQASPVDVDSVARSAVESFDAVDPTIESLQKREVSYGNPHRVTDQGNRFKLNYESRDGHPNACPGHFECYISRPGRQQTIDRDLGNPDNMVDEGNRWRLNYGSTSGHDKACPGHYICYFYK